MRFEIEKEWRGAEFRYFIYIDGTLKMPSYISVEEAEKACDEWNSHPIGVNGRWEYKPKTGGK